MEAAPQGCLCVSPQ